MSLRQMNERIKQKFIYLEKSVKYAEFKAIKSANRLEITNDCEGRGGNVLASNTRSWSPGFTLWRKELQNSLWPPRLFSTKSVNELCLRKNYILNEMKIVFRIWIFCKQIMFNFCLINHRTSTKPNFTDLSWTVKFIYPI